MSGFNIQCAPSNSDDTRTSWAFHASSPRVRGLGANQISALLTRFDEA